MIELYKNTYFPLQSQQTETEIGRLARLHYANSPSRCHFVYQMAELQICIFMRLYRLVFTAATSSRCFRVGSSVPHDALRFHGVHHSPSPPAIQWGQLAGLRKILMALLHLVERADAMDCITSNSSGIAGTAFVVLRLAA